MLTIRICLLERISEASFGLLVNQGEIVRLFVIKQQKSIEKVGFWRPYSFHLFKDLHSL